MLEWLIVAAFGALAAVDTTAFFQGMFHQPLAICTLLGAALGVPYEGAFFGGLLQLLWMGDLPVGSRLAPEAGPAAAGAAGGVLIGINAGFLDLGIGALVVLVLAIPSAYLAGHLVNLQREKQGKLAHRARDAVAAGRPGRLYGILLTGIVRTAAWGAVVTVAVAGAARLVLELPLLAPLARQIPPYALLAGMAAVGLGGMLGLFRNRELLGWLAGGLALGIVASAVLA